MLANIKTRPGKMVFCYLNGKHSIPLMLPVVRMNEDVEFYFHARSFAGVDFMATQMAECPNAHFVGNFDELKFKLNLFGAFITTDANAAHAHVYSLKLVKMFEAMGVPVLELQHGLFQLGLHYYDVPSGTAFYGDSLPSCSFASHVLAYYPPVSRAVPYTVIGYPPYSGVKPKGGAGDYLLILTNLHWPTYAVAEKEAFYEAVVRLADEHPELPVVWKMHHVEASPAAATWKYVNEALARHPGAKARIRFAHADAGLKGKTAAEIIAGAKCVVSTVSTVLLDCEILRRPTAVYGCASNASLMALLSKADAFHDFDSLRRLFEKGFRPIRTGKLRPYDNEAFRAALDKMYKPSSLSSGEFLSLLMSQAFRDDFIARNTATKDAAISALKKGDEIKSGELDRLRSALSEAEAAKGRLDAEAALRRGDVEAARKDIAALSEKLADAARENGRLAEEASGLRRRLDEAVSGAEAVRRELEGKIESLGSDVAAMHDCTRENARLSKELAEAKGRAADLSEALSTVQDRLLSEVKGARECNSALMSRLEAMEEKKEEVVADNARLASENARLTEELAEARGRAADLSAALSASQDGSKQFKLKADRRFAEIAVLKERLKKSQAAEAASKGKAESTGRQLAAANRALRECREREDACRLSKRIHRFAKGVMPYGLTCMWKRMAYGIAEDKPLLYYPGFFKRARRVIKFLLPYFAVAAFKREKYGRRH